MVSYNRDFFMRLRTWFLWLLVFAVFVRIASYTAVYFAPVGRDRLQQEVERRKSGGAGGSAQKFVSVVAQGSGTRTEPYRIGEFGNILWLNNEIVGGRTAGKFYTLTKTIGAPKNFSMNPLGYRDERTTQPAAFEGTFAGDGRSVFGVKIANKNAQRVGFFAEVGTSGTVTNFNLVNLSVQGARSVGGVSGVNRGRIENCKVISSNVMGESLVGGIAGVVVGKGRVSHTLTSDTLVAGKDSVGGVAGAVRETAVVSRANAETTVTGIQNVGGIAGLVNGRGVLERCALRAGRVAGKEAVGGIAGELQQYARVERSYTAAPVAGDIHVGGVAGVAGGTSVVRESFMSGAKLSAKGNIGGVVAQKSELATVERCYWDSQAWGVSASDGGVGCTTAQMRRRETFAEWDFEKVWDMAQGARHPTLRR